MIERKGKIGKTILSADGRELGMHFWWTKKDVYSYFLVVCHVLHDIIGILGARLRKPAKEFFVSVALLKDWHRLQQCNAT